jgi:hypothetical protein
MKSVSILKTVLACLLVLGSTLVTSEARATSCLHFDRSAGGVRWCCVTQFGWECNTHWSSGENILNPLPTNDTQIPLDN